MAKYIISSKQPINWSAKGHQRILQNITNLLNTFMYEVAYDRILGRNPKNIDKPQEQFVPSVIAETYEIIETYEPRATIKSVEIINEDGENAIKVVVDIE